MISRIRPYLTPNFFAGYAIILTAYAAIIGNGITVYTLFFSLFAFMSGAWANREKNEITRFISYSFLALYLWLLVRGLFAPIPMSIAKNDYLDVILGRFFSIVTLSIFVYMIIPLLKNLTLSALARHSRYAVLLTFIIMVPATLLEWVPPRYHFLHVNTLRIATMVGVASFVGFADWREADMKTKLLAILCLLLTFSLQFIVTQGRAAILGMISVLPILFIFLVHSLNLSRTNKALVSFVFIAFGAIFAAFIWNFIINEAMMTRITNMWLIMQNPDPALAAKIERSLALRLDFWQAAVQAIAEKPILGHGPQMRFEAAAPYLEVYGELHKQMQFPHVHNEIFSFWISGGILAVIFYLNVVFIPLSVLFLLKLRDARYFFVAIMFIIMNLWTGLGDTYYVDSCATYWSFYYIAFAAVAMNRKRKNALSHHS